MASRPRTSGLRRTFAALGAVALLGGLAACGSDDEPEAGERGSAISAERCAENEAAGPVTYMSSYYWQASASILEVIAADKLGYFNDLCLDVELQAGTDTIQAAKLVASGKVSVAAISQQDVITNNANGIKVTGVSSYSNAGAEVLITNDDVTELKQLKGTKLGHKGWVPLSLTAMLAENGIDAAKDVEQIKVGYDPTVLTRGQVDSLTGFLSNDVRQLEAAGEKVTVFKPADFGVADSLGGLAVNPEFAEKHPTAVQDFLRAAFKAFQYCAEDAHVDECIELQGEQAGAESDPAHEKGVWTTESKLAAENPLPGKFGSVDLDNVVKMAAQVGTFAGLEVTAEEAKSYFDPSFGDAVVDDSGAVVWPAP
ncbi:ABC transporter substrate-binding protein [Nocardioides yefusunii]|uniref:Thiamine pyrimidine synthase n=1 Tax=Nocardioides yefusunii TaxID=2500546 RepID=A0ABW1R2A9_9ACTN|nr:ABC transporter substrate-binding protein [Nocardioides yefusunii]